MNPFEKNKIERFKKAIAASKGAPFNNKSRTKNTFDFLTDSNFQWRNYSLKNPMFLMVENHPAKRIALIILGIISLVVFVYLLRITWNYDIEVDDYWPLAPLGLIATFAINLFIVMFYVKRTETLEFSTNGVLFHQKIIVPYSDISFIHFRRSKTKGVVKNYLVFRFNNRPKKEIDIAVYPHSKKEIGEMIYVYMKQFASEDFNEAVANSYRNDEILDAE